MKTDLIEPSKSPALRPPPQPGLGLQLIGDEEERFVLEVLRSKRLFRYAYGVPPHEQGRFCSALEREFSRFAGTRHALAVTSGTAALETALMALGVGPGDEVILPAWSWIACFTAIVRLGALPVLAEIDDSFCLAPDEIRRLRTPRTKAVMVIHYQGAAAEMDSIVACAKESGLAVLEDCAQAAGASYKGRKVGSFGDIAIFSFQAQKMISSGEGGLVLTNDGRLHERAVRAHDLGQFRPFHAAQMASAVPVFCGAQYRMSELTAAVALAQFHRLEGILGHCRRLSAIIRERVEPLPAIHLRRLPDPEGECGIENYLCLPDLETAQEFTRRLHARNVHCQKMTGTYSHYARGYCRSGAVHTPGASPFARFPEWPAPGYRASDFPRTESLIRSFVAIPVGVLYREEDARYIADCVEAVYHEIF